MTPAEPLTPAEKARLRERLADVERHLREMPPHGGAAREELEATRRELQRRLGDPG